MSINRKIPGLNGKFSPGSYSKSCQQWINRKGKKKSLQASRCFSKCFSRRQQILGSSDYPKFCSYCGNDRTFRDLVRKEVRRGFCMRLQAHIFSYLLSGPHLYSAGTKLNIPAFPPKEILFWHTSLSATQTQNWDEALEISISFTRWTKSSVNSCDWIRLAFLTKSPLFPSSLSMPLSEHSFPFS